MPESRTRNCASKPLSTPARARALMEKQLLMNAADDGYDKLSVAGGVDALAASVCADDANSEDEFDMAARAVNWVLEAYGVPGGRAVEPGTEQITIRYRKPRNETQQFIMERLQEWQIIEGIVEFMSDRFALPEAAEIIVRECGSPNAYWDPDYRELIFCYDLLEGLRKLGDAPAVQQLAAHFQAARD